jgi:hypothetical protein
MGRRLWIVAVAALVFPACRPDTVALVYRYEDGATLRYRMTADAHAAWNIVEPGNGSYSVVFDVSEEVVAVDGAGAVVEITLTPIEVSEEGLPAPGTEERSFELRVGSSGEVREIVSVDGVAAANLDPDELSFIGTYRPPLPLEPVALHGAWRSRQEVRVGNAFQSTVSTGELESLGADKRGEFAELVYSSRGPLSWSLSLPEGKADLEGAARSSGDVTFALGDGLLRTAHSRTEGDFTVAIARTEAEPVTWGLHLELELHLELIRG